MRQKKELHVYRQKLNLKAAADAEKAAVVETDQEVADQQNVVYQTADLRAVVADPDCRISALPRGR